MSYLLGASTISYPPVCSLAPADPASFSNDCRLRMYQVPSVTSDEETCKESVAVRWFQVRGLSQADARCAKQPIPDALQTVKKTPGIGDHLGCPAKRSFSASHCWVSWNWKQLDRCYKRFKLPTASPTTSLMDTEPQYHLPSDVSLSLSLFVSCQPQTPTFLHQQDVATKRATPNQLVPAHWRRPDVPDSPNHVLRPWIVLCARTVRDLFPLFSDFIRFKCVYMYVYIVYIICFIYHTYESHSNLCQPTTEATLLGGVYTFYGGEMFQQSTGILVWQDWLGAALANVCWRKKRDKLHVLQLELVHGL